MAKFKKIPELQYNEKYFIKTDLKPLLEKNDCVGVRQLSLKYKVQYPNVLPFLLNHLGERLYFSGSDEIFSNEFRDCDLLNIIIPPTIKQINDKAFSYCDSLRYIKITNTNEMTVEANSFMYSDDLVIYVPRSCNLITTQGQSGRVLDDDSVGVAKETTLEKRMEKAKENWEVSSALIDGVDVLFELVDEHLFSKIKWY